MFTELFGSSPFKGKVCFCTILLVTFLTVWSCSDSEKVNPHRPSVHKDEIYLVDQYVGADTCAECHDQVHEKWEDSPPFSRYGIAQ